MGEGVGHTLAADGSGGVSFATPKTNTAFQRSTKAEADRAQVASLIVRGDDTAEASTQVSVLTTWA